MSNRQVFKARGVTINDVVKRLGNPARRKPEICFPFDGELFGNEFEVMTKVLFINKRESTQIKNKDVDRLAAHIQCVVSDDDNDVIRRGEPLEEYCDIVCKIATGHGIHNSRTTTESDLTSFASKYCGSHNQSLPFWDNLVNDFLQFVGYKHKQRNYFEYVQAIKQLQKENGLDDYSLREIEESIWWIAKEAAS